MTDKEFRERLFDVINESEEIFIRDIEFIPEKEKLYVSVGDGTHFVITCSQQEPCKENLNSNRVASEPDYKNILALYNSEHVHDTCNKLSPAYNERITKTDRLISNFYDIISEELQNIFQQIRMESLEYQRIKCESSFIEGFKIGMKLTIEALKE